MYWWQPYKPYCFYQLWWWYGTIVGLKVENKILSVQSIGRLAIYHGSKTCTTIRRCGRDGNGIGIVAGITGCSSVITKLNTVALMVQGTEQGSNKSVWALPLHSALYIVNHTDVMCFTICRQHYFQHFSILTLIIFLSTVSQGAGIAAIDKRGHYADGIYIICAVVCCSVVAAIIIHYINVYFTRTGTWLKYI